MTKMFVANCTQQIQDFQYRLPERAEMLRQSIAIGGQIVLADDLRPMDVDAVKDQHERYNMIHVDRIGTVRAFVPLVYSLDRPVRSERIAEQVEANQLILVERGRKIRQDAAIAVNARVENQLAEDRAEARLNQLEMSVVEENRDPRDESPEVAEGVRVTRGEARADIDTPLPARRRAAGRRRARAPKLAVVTPEEPWQP